MILLIYEIHSIRDESVLGKIITRSTLILTSALSQIVVLLVRDLRSEKFWVIRLFRPLPLPEIKGIFYRTVIQSYRRCTHSGRPHSGRFPAKNASWPTFFEREKIIGQVPKLSDSSKMRTEGLEILKPLFWPFSFQYFQPPCTWPRNFRKKSATVGTPPVLVISTFWSLRFR